VHLWERKARELVMHMLRSRITEMTALCFRRRLRAMVVRSFLKTPEID
jgi:hypothetical protein